MKLSDKLKNILNHFEEYLAAILFGFTGILLAVQVFSRYVLNHSYAWTEELATLLFVPMIYCGISAAVTRRKHVSIEILQQFSPFKIKKGLKITSQLIFLFFCCYIQIPFFKVIQALGSSQSSLLRIPKNIIYFTIPICLVLTAVRIIQDIIRLYREDESNLGYSKPTIDLDSCEREAELARERGEI